jgi:hypothetical protein
MLWLAFGPGISQKSIPVAAKPSELVCDHTYKILRDCYLPRNYGIILGAHPHF